jgi:hypothetical protein
VANAPLGWRCRRRQRPRQSHLGDAGQWAIAGCSSVWPRPTSAWRGHEHPHGKKRHLRNWPELGDGGFAKTPPPRVSRLGRMFMARFHRRALAFLGFWVQLTPQSARRIGTA